MEPAHIFYKELPIGDDNIFTKNLSEKSELQGMLFKKSNEFAVTGLSINQDTYNLIEVTDRNRKKNTTIINRKPIRSRQILVPKTFQGRPPRTSPGHPLKILFDRPRDNLYLTSMGRPNLTFKGRPQDVLRTSRRGSSEYSNLHVPAFYVTFLSELIRLTKSI